MRTCYIQQGGQGGGPGFPQNAPACFQTRFSGNGTGLLMKMTDDWFCFFTAGNGATVPLGVANDGTYGYVSSSGVIPFRTNPRYAQNFGIVACVPRVDVHSEESTDYAAALALAKETVSESLPEIAGNQYTIQFPSVRRSKAAGGASAQWKGNIWLGTSAASEGGYGAFLDTVRVNPDVPVFTASSNRKPVFPMSSNWNINGTWYANAIFNSFSSSVWTHSNITSTLQNDVYWYHQPDYDKTTHTLNGLLLPAGATLADYEAGAEWFRSDFTSSWYVRYSGPLQNYYPTFALIWVIVLPSEVDFNV